MSDAHDIHVLNDLIAAIRETEGAPEAAAAELEQQVRSLGGQGVQSGGHSVIEAAREALGGIAGMGRNEPAGLHDGGEVQRLAALLGRMQAALDDDRLSGLSRDAVLRAFDPVKAARDAALQQAG